MRFKNLTITLTLTCLSLVALAGLVLLPITDAIGNWTTSSNGCYANYYASQNQDNRSWYLQAEVNAKGVTASGNVNILNEDRYSTNWKQMGNANVSASRENYTWYHRYISGFFACNEWGAAPGQWYDRCQGHHEEGDADSNVEGEPGFKPGRHTDITLDIKVREEKYKVVSGKSKKKKITVSAEVGVSYLFLSGESTFQYEGETVIALTISIEKVRKTVTNEAKTSSQDAAVDFDPKANSKASASVSFDGSSGEKKVEYKAPVE